MFLRSVRKGLIGSGGEANKLFQLIFIHLSIEIVDVPLQLVEPFWCEVKLGRRECTFHHVDKDMVHLKMEVVHVPETQI